MRMISAAASAFLLLGSLAIGAGTAGAAPVAAPAVAESASLVEVHDRGRDRWRTDRNWRGDRGYSRGYDRNWRRQQARTCYTTWQIRYGYYGPQWVRVQQCYRGRGW